MSNQALFLMCAQNSYLDSKGTVYLGEKAEILKTRLKDYLSDFKGIKIFFREAHIEADKFFITKKTHSIVNTYDFNIVHELKEYADYFYNMTCYNAFYKTDLEGYLKKEVVSKVVVVGLETHTSVLFTVEELRNRFLGVEIIEPLIISHDNYLHNFAISIMVNNLGVIYHG